MRRHPGLRLLSEEHYFALAQARDLRSVGSDECELLPKEVLSRFLAFWDQGGHHHFRKEEELLLPLYSRYAPINTVEMLTLFIQHTQIRQQVLQLRTAAELPERELLAILHKLGQDFEIHIRQEERIVFPLVEATIPDELLSAFESYALS
jgi:iron-sulfur cluster repair protein YtfE (RIC family)